MCIKCCEMEELVENDEINLKLIEQFIKGKSIELYAGNCFPNEISYYMDKGNYYTINMIFKCNYCNEYYYIGFCLYGKPIIKIIDENDVKNRISSFEWGYVGTYFTNQ